MEENKYQYNFVSFTLSDDLHDELEDYCSLTGERKSDFFRRAIKRELERVSVHYPTAGAHGVKIMKLTKRALRSLPERVFIVSGVGSAPDKPAYASHVVPHRYREQQWRDIKEVGAAQRQVMVFSSPNDYEKWLKEVWGAK